MNVDTKLVCRVWIGETASVAHDIAHVGVFYKQVRAGMFAEDAEGLILGNSEILGSTEYGDDCIDWTKDGMI
jgi:hypothetical protein